MKRISLFAKRLFTVSCLLLTAIPVSAATPSQQLDKAVKSMSSMTSYGMDVSFNLDFSERNIGTAALGSNGKVVVSTHLVILDKTNGEGRMSLDKLSISASNGIMALQLDSPLAVEWKVAGDMFYFRLAEAPTTLIDMLKSELNIDAAPLIGMWIGVESKEGIQQLNDLPIAGISSISTELPQGLSTQPAIRNLPWFNVLRIEKRFKNAANEDILRLRVRINPALITALQREEIRRLPRGRYYAEDLKSLNKRYTDLRINLAKLQFVVNLNTTKTRVERMEVGGTITEPKESCTYNVKTKKDVCRTASISSFKLAIGIDIRPVSGITIIPPAIWKTVDQIKQMIEDMTSPTDTEETDDMTQTITAQ